MGVQFDCAGERTIVMTEGFHLFHLSSGFVLSELIRLFLCVGRFLKKASIELLSSWFLYAKNF